MARDPGFVGWFPKREGLPKCHEEFAKVVNLGEEFAIYGMSKAGFPALVIRPWHSVVALNVVVYSPPLLVSRDWLRLANYYRSRYGWRPGLALRLFVSSASVHTRRAVSRRAGIALSPTTPLKACYDQLYQYVDSGCCK